MIAAFMSLALSVNLIVTLNFSISKAKIWGVPSNLCRSIEHMEDLGLEVRSVRYHLLRFGRAASREPEKLGRQ